MCVDDLVGNLSAGAGFAVELVLDVAALPKKALRDLALFDCRAPAKSTPRGMKRPGIVLSFSNIATMTDEWTGAWAGRWEYGRTDVQTDRNIDRDRRMDRWMD